jgi:uncharacterized membrane protein YfcA
VATSVFVVVVTVLVAVIGHGYAFAREADEGAIQQVLAVATFTVPGVLIGGQVGPRVASRVNPEHLKLAISVIFMAVGAFMLYTLTF